LAGYERSIAFFNRFISRSGFQNKFSDWIEITCERAYPAIQVEDEEMIGCRPTTPPTSQISTLMSTRQPSSTNEKPKLNVGI
jgi:hypothetical protein